METVMDKSPKRFRLGQIMATPGALAACEESGEDTIHFIQRHAHGDWGDLDAHDKAMNEQAIAREGDPEKQLRVLSCYRTRKGVKLYVITEWDRSYTTILLTEDY
jgi:hypothetical protein